MHVLIIDGNLGRDAEVRYTQGGTAVCAFPVANKTGYGDKERTHWFDCALWGKRAEGGLPKYLTKGTRVLIRGEVRLNEFEKRDGSNGAKLAVFVHDIELGGSKPSGQQPAQSQPQQIGQPQQQPGPADDFDDDIPF
ncbi:MAG TPA: single-stranded DNA-binding protein [Arenicellales bacterium]|nr:single-stranded DNA-binding protein [Arenicellales bacterium]